VPSTDTYNPPTRDYAVVDPQWLFRLTGQPRMTHPAVFRTLGMVLDLDGILYPDVARDPEDGFLVTAVGLAGTSLGPAGFARIVATGQWPTGAAVSILTNDLVWWGPSAPYCHGARPSFRTSLVRSSMQT